MHAAVFVWLKATNFCQWNLRSTYELKGVKSEVVQNAQRSHTYKGMHNGICGVYYITNDFKNCKQNKPSATNYYYGLLIRNITTTAIVEQLSNYTITNQEYKSE